MKFRCPACKKVLSRNSQKSWVKSFCEKAGRTVRLQRVISRPLKGKTKRNRVISTV